MRGIAVTVPASEGRLSQAPRRALLRSWTAWVTAGEAAGFAVPATAGALYAQSEAAIGIPALLVAGAVEGAMLGWAQAHVLRRVLPGLPARRWIAATSIAAVFAYAMGLLPSTVAASWPTPALIALLSVAAPLLLLSIGAAQWTVLRHQLPHSARWIFITAGGWLAGLGVFMLVASPLWQEGQPWWLTIAIGCFAGLLMAATVALLTGLGLVRMLSNARNEG